MRVLCPIHAAVALGGLASCARVDDAPQRIVADSLAGVVVDEDGNPLAGIAVESCGYDRSTVARTDANGAYTVRYLGSARAANVELYFRGEHRETRSWIPWGAGDQRVVLPQRSLVIDVFDESGRPHRDVVGIALDRLYPDVAFAPLEAARVGDRWVVDAPQGVFQLRVRFGDDFDPTLRVLVQCTGRSPWLRVDVPAVRSRRVRVPAADARSVCAYFEVEDVSIPVRNHDCRAAIAESPDLQGCAEVSTTMGRARAVQSTEYTLRCLGAVARVKVSSDGCRSTWIRLPMGARDTYEVCLEPLPEPPPPASGVGQVLADEDLREHLTSGRLRVRMQPVQRHGLRIARVGEANGSFGFSHFDPGWYDVVLEDPPSVTTGQRVLPAPGPNQGLVLDLRGQRRVHRLLQLRTGGAPAPSSPFTIVPITLSDEPPRSAIRVETDPEGRCAASLLPGTYRVEAARRCSAPIAISAEVAPGELVVDVDAAALALRMIHSGGQPVFGGTCWLLGARPGSRHIELRSDGDALATASLLPDTYTVNCHTWESRVAAWRMEDTASAPPVLATVTLRPGERRELTVVLPDDALR